MARSSATRPPAARAADQRALLLISGLQRNVRRSGRSAGRQQRQGPQPEHHRPRMADSPPRLRRPRRGVRIVGRVALDPQRRTEPDSGRLRLESRCRAPTTDREREINQLAADLPRHWDYGPVDAPIVYAAIETLRTRKPRVLYVMLGEGDEWAHQGRYDLYLDATYRADRFIERIWDDRAGDARVRRSNVAAADNRPRTRSNHDRLDGPRARRAGGGADVDRRARPGRARRSASGAM